MSKVIMAVPLVVLCVLIISVPSVWGSWVEDGVAICTASGDQYDPQITSDGTGGAIITWYATGGYYIGIYAQRLDASGTVQWTANGVALCRAIPGESYPPSPQITSDGAGGAIVTWWDARSMNANIYAQRVNASGAVQWAADGVALCAATGDQYNPAIASDGAGGAIATWYDTRSGGYDIYAQRVNASGVVQWAADGVAISTSTRGEMNQQIVSDGAGGAIITWGGGTDIYAQRIDASGAVQWTTDGVAICAATGSQGIPYIISDGAGGAIVAWMDSRSSAYDIYAQRIDASGAVQWTTDGVELCNAADQQFYSHLASDGAGGAIVTWFDYRSGGTDIYIQRVDASGTVLWAADGVPLCTATGNQWNSHIVSDGAGGAIITWYDDRSGSSDIYAQRVNASGAAQWMADGVPLCTANESQLLPQIASDGAAGAIVTWYDYRSGTNYDIYAERVDLNGFPAGSGPRIDDVADIPEDQGGWVRMRVARSKFDGLYEGPYPITGYNIWRKVSGVAALSAPPPSTGMTAAESNAVELFYTSPERSRGLKLSGAAAAALGLPSGTWESLGFHAAMQEEYYDFAVPTKSDSTSAGTPWETYVVTAHTTTPTVHVTSEPDSSYSVDNLPPGAPLGLVAEQSFDPEGLQLAWDENGEPDLWHYSVYRGASADFVPSGGNRVAMPTDVSYFDSEWRWSSGYYYKLSAADRHGNESGFALLTPNDVTGSETPKAPAASYLSQNYPNPFNPTTRIAFGLSAPAHVSLRIYDAVGRLVRALVEGDRPAGNFGELWDGRDSNGRAVSSGIYFYRLAAGNFVETKKMALMR